MFKSKRLRSPHYILGLAQRGVGGVTPTSSHLGTRR